MKDMSKLKYGAEHVNAMGWMKYRCFLFETSEYKNNARAI
jgi:hypothetical protein